MRYFAFFYFMSDEHNRVRDTVRSHVAYWKALGLTGYRGGPFSDRSGGLILFSAESVDDAAAAVRADPFVEAGLLAEMWMKEWIPE
jgi:uncharacterized protein YciI